MNFDIRRFLENYSHNVKDCGSYFQCPCPVHLGDGFAFVWWNESKAWHCFSHNCEETYGRGIKGLIKGVLKTYNDELVQKELSKYDFGNINVVNNSSIKINNRLSENSVIEKIPIYWCDEVANFGYTKELCNKYEIGGLKSKYGYINSVGYRIYNRFNNYLGYTARLLDSYRQYIFEKYGEMPSKWRHSRVLNVVKYYMENNGLI